jgi:hypothetical protein
MNMNNTQGCEAIGSDNKVKGKNLSGLLRKLTMTEKEDAGSK